MCTSQGALNLPPPTNGLSGKGVPGTDSFLYDDLYDFACSRGYCPKGACTSATTPLADVSGASAMDPFIEHCTAEQQNILRTAWVEAGTLAKLQYVSTPVLLEQRY